MSIKVLAFKASMFILLFLDFASSVTSLFFLNILLLECNNYDNKVLNVINWIYAYQFYSVPSNNFKNSVRHHPILLIFD